MIIKRYLTKLHQNSGRVFKNQLKSHSLKKIARLTKYKVHLTIMINDKSN